MDAARKVSAAARGTVPMAWAWFVMDFKVRRLLLAACGLDEQWELFEWDELETGPQVLILNKIAQGWRA